MGFVHIELREMINEIGEDKTKVIISDFYCRDSDIVKFIKKNAIRFENDHISRTTLIFTDDEEKRFVAYYTIANKPFLLEEGINKSKRRKLVGSSLSGSNIVPGILIGQISKNEHYKNLINGDEILSHIFQKIKTINNLLASQIIFLNCKDNEQLKTFYEKNGFIYFKEEIHENGQSQLTYTIPTKSIVE